MVWWRRKKKEGTPDPGSDPLSTVRWIPAEESEFGVEVLDCREFTASVHSLTQDPKIGDAFAALRAVDGREYLGKTPESPLRLECDLSYSHRGETRDGPLFKAACMEDKWDIYLYDGGLYFTRSWTGQLAYVAEIRFSESSANVVSVLAPGDSMSKQPGFHVRAMDFLVRSHLYRQMFPHPLPKSLGRDERAQGLFSFSQFGRYGLLGTFEDITHLPPPKLGRAHDGDPRDESVPDRSRSETGTGKERQ
ncbi:MAG: hypothetical protein R3E97_19955 [Candidatus Eisenbacteria bacterium]